MQNKKIYYPIAGMNYIIDTLPQLFENKEPSNKDEIKLYISAQLNSYPHIGTLVNFMSAFALAKQITANFGIKTIIHLDLLENVTGEEVIINGNKYYKSLKNTIGEDGVSLSEKYFPYFLDILEKLKILDDIEYETQFFEDYQKEIDVRDALLEIMNNRDIIGNVINPKDGEIYLRFPCPKCGLIDKHNINKKIEYIDKEKIVLSNICPYHGEHQIEISKNSNQFFDMNVPLRYITKALYLIRKDHNNNTLSIIVDGGDWAGMWPLRIYMEPLIKLGYSDVMNVVYTPTILDWSGSKLSKRIYVGSKSYKEYLKEGLIDYSKFYTQYGKIGFERLHNEVNSWVAEPKKFLRDYTIEYIDLILRGDYEK